jgi:hypothetical protein
MGANPVVVESERLRAIATFNGRTRCNVLVYDRSDQRKPLLVDDVNLAAAGQRGTVIEALDVGYRAEAEPLLTQLAAVVAAERTKVAKVDGSTDAGAFPVVEPWPETVNGAALLEELRDLILAHVVLPQHAAEALALWVAHTYVTDVTDYTPYILVTSPVRECGKTTLLELLLYLAHRAKFTSGITAAALYRHIERYIPTMLLDELDTRLRGDAGEMLRGVLNSGFQRGGTVTVCVGDEHETRDFRTFCPKVLAGVGRVWDTVTSRSIPIRLARASRDQLIQLRKIRGDRIDAACLPHRRRLMRWTGDVREALSVTDPVTPAALGARQADVWRPLFAIADEAGEAWPQTARDAALALHGVAEEEGDYGLLLLEDVRDLFRNHGTDALFSAAIIQELGQREDRPWPEYRGDKPITTRGLASLLARFGLKPKTVRVGIETAKGYKMAELAPVFATYLPSDPSVTSVTNPDQEDDSTSVTDVTDTKDIEGALEREAIQDEGSA